MPSKNRGFTLIELLTVIAIIGILAGIVLPAMSRAREKSRTLVCLTHLRELGAAWQIYAGENEEVLVPGRMFEHPTGTLNPANWYDVGNGLKYRPTWAALLGAEIGVFAFNEPKKDEERQDYDQELYQCPIVPHWIDERNYAYGYNYQFLGNARQTSTVYHNFPVKRHRIKAPGMTVVVGDSMGTAAGVAKFERGAYVNDGVDINATGNHGWSLDPPRLTDKSDRGTGDDDCPRTAVDPRHRGKANVVFADEHGATMTARELGYRTSKTGRYVDLDPAEDGGGGGIITASVFGGHDDIGEGPLLLGNLLQADPESVVDATNNRLFSGTGRDIDPPDVPTSSGQ